MNKTTLIVCTIFTLIPMCFMRDLSVCPNQEELSPKCTCEKSCVTCMKIITCNNILNPQEILQMYNNSGDFTLDSLKITNSTMLYMPISQLDIKQIRRLGIYYSSLSGVFDSLPPEQNVIEHMTFSEVMVQRGIDWRLFSTLHLLKVLDLADVRIRRITNTFGENMPKNLTDISFNRTETTRISDNAFTPLSQLQTIRVVSCKIRTIKRSMFPRPFSGTLIDFEGNLIEDIPDDFFSDMPHIISVMLANNRLLTLKEPVFGNLPSSVTVISLSDNPIVCDCSVSWLARKGAIPLIRGKCVENGHVNSGKPLQDLQDSDFSDC